ncbi:MAG: 6-bladed beta-propeller [Patescibacteria group bacterium]|nr:6-bladed beta-propeller [Patescibacteria group bacterium]
MTNKIFWKIGIGAVLIVLIVWGVNSVNKEQEKELSFSYERDLVWGGYGTDEGEFDLPYGSDIVSIDGEDFIFISDCHNNNVQKFTLDGVFISRFGELGSEPGQLDHPADIKIDKDKNIWVVEEDNRRLSIFNYNGEFIDNFEITAKAAIGDTGEIYGITSEPLSVAFDSQGNTYLSDFGMSRVFKFSPSGDISFMLGYGVEAGEISIRTEEVSIGTGDGEFDGNYYIEVDSQDNLYVVDRGNHRIQKFDPNGNFLLKWGRNGGDGTPGNQPGEFNWPHEIAIDKYDNVYIADTFNKRIQIFNSNGGFLHQFGGDGVFTAPKTVAVDEKLTLFIGDVGGETTYDEEEREFHYGHEDEVTISRWKNVY